MTYSKALELRDDCKGSAVAEFAMIAPVVIMMIAGSVEIGYLAMVRSTLEGVTTTAARRAMTGSCPETRAEDMRAYVTSSMAPYKARHASPSVEVKSYGDRLANVGKPEPFVDANANDVYDQGEDFDDLNGDGVWSEDMGSVGDLGGPGDVVVYQSAININPLFPMLGWASDSGLMRITAETVVRNEPVFSGNCQNVQIAEAEEK